MALFQCKMCGGKLKIDNGESVVCCEYCGTQQTLPNLNDEKRSALYERANHFRRNNEFDKAAEIYEQILNEDATDAEAYWSVVLCSYGVEYVEDPSSGRRVPTVNRIQYTSVFDDENYKSAIKYADDAQRAVYKAEAEIINNIQKNYLEISSKEKPFDVFICYKETDSQGRRTPDSVLASELYHELTEEGFKVFFSRITLEDKLGIAYEPYIFAALNSARVMVVLGTKPEYFNAVWVKNEWSRYLSLIKAGAKKMLVPAYRDMDPYNLPEEFSHLQAQDMSKLGFMQDLIRGIGKIVRGYSESNKSEPAAAAKVTEQSPLLKRAQLFLSDGYFAEAIEYCEKVLDSDPENADAYVCQLLAQAKVTYFEGLEYCSTYLDTLPAYKNALRFADQRTAERLCDYNRRIYQRIGDKAGNEKKKQKNKHPGFLSMMWAIICYALTVVYSIMALSGDDVLSAAAVCALLGTMSLMLNRSPAGNPYLFGKSKGMTKAVLITGTLIFVFVIIIVFGEY